MKTFEDLPLEIRLVILNMSRKNAFRDKINRFERIYVPRRMKISRYSYHEEYILKLSHNSLCIGRYEGGARFMRYTYWEDCIICGKGKQWYGHDYSVLLDNWDKLVYYHSFHRCHKCWDVPLPKGLFEIRSPITI